MKNTILGIIYIFWIFVAWFIVNLCNPTNIIIRECIRFFVFIGPVLVLIICNIKKPWHRWLGLYGCKKGSVYKTFIVAFIYAMICSVINIYGFHKTAHLSSIPHSFWLTTFSLSIIMEEIAFRGLLFYLFKKWNKNTIVIVTSLAFVVKHIPGWFLFPMGLSQAGFIGDSLMVFLVGCVLGSLYFATHSIWATSLVHGINNLIVALFY